MHLLKAISNSIHSKVIPASAMRCVWLIAWLLFLTSSPLMAQPATPSGNNEASRWAREWPELTVGASLDGCQKAILAWDARASIQVLALCDPQSVVRGLVESGLLRAINKAGVVPWTKEGAVGKDGAYLVASAAGGKLAVAFSGGKLQAWLWRAPVQVDASVGEKENAFTAARLAPLHGLFNEVGRRCKVRSKGEAGSGLLRVVGHCGAQRVFVEYVPEDDEVWLVFSK